MLEATITLANDDLDRVKAWIEDEQEELVKDMIASRPTFKTDSATTVFTMLGNLRSQIIQFQEKLERLEEEHRSRG